MSICPPSIKILTTRDADWGGENSIAIVPGKICNYDQFPALPCQKTWE